MRESDMIDFIQTGELTVMLAQQIISGAGGAFRRGMPITAVTAAVCLDKNYPSPLAGVDALVLAPFARPNILGVLGDRTNPQIAATVVKGITIDVIDGIALTGVDYVSVQP